MALEEPNKMSDVLKSTACGNVNDGVSGIDQLVPCFEDPVGVDVFDGRFPGMFFK